MGRRIEQQSGPATRSVALAATTALDVVSVHGGPTDSVIANAAGNFVGQLENDTTDRTIAMIAGYQYRLRIKEVDVTNAIALTLLFNTPA